MNSGIPDKALLAKMISSLENGESSLHELKSRFSCDSGSFIIGITGPPGVGKSTIVNLLIREFRKKGDNVAVIAIDPTSFRSGGALLGDRIRMQSNACDSGVFIRSMATRGHLGGLAEKTAEVSELLSSAGFQTVIIETVGVGQTEIEIVNLADAVVAVTSPASGDEIQMMKAGIYEIADLIVLNKSDLKGADNIFKELEKAAAEISGPDWKIPVLKLTATEQQGVSDLFNSLDQYYQFYKRCT